MSTPSIREMKEALAAAGVSFADCSEKSELVARYQNSMANAASKPRATAPPRENASKPSPNPRPANTSRAPAAPPKQLSVEEMGKTADGSDGGELGQEIRRVCSSKDFYEILKVNRSCGEEELKKAYRKLALRLHPDKCNLSGAEEAFKKVSTAFGCLHDSRQRASYDIHGEDIVQRGRGGWGGSFGADVDAEELFKAYCQSGSKVENVAAAIKKNPWLLLTLLTEPPMYPVGTLVVFAVLSQVVYLLQAFVLPEGFLD